MGQYNEEEINKKIAELPGFVRGMVFDPAVGMKVQAIGKKYNLHIDRFDDLLYIVRLALIGLVDEQTIHAEIAETLEVDTDTARKISMDIGSQITAPILQKLREEQQKKQETDVEEITDEEIDALLEEAERADTDLSGSDMELIDETREEEQVALPSTDRDMLLEQVESVGGIGGSIRPQNAVAEEIKRGIPGEKLSGNFKIASEERDYSVNKQPDKGAVSLKVVRHRDRVDPYREPVE